MVAGNRRPEAVAAFRSALLAALEHKCECGRMHSLTIAFSFASIADRPAVHAASVQPTLQK